ncbi:MAG: hypothetical protein DRP87_04770 [Spirochaetes bacterium]|nr:MAG: hypothetical protein DRP87_04770 [Spirochaetota bacterium]
MISNKVLQFIFLTCFIIFFPVFTTSPADLLVPSMELITRGYLRGGAFHLATLGAIDISVAGGYKFGGNLLFNLENENLEDITSETSLAFKAASVTIKDMFSLPINMTYYTGEIEEFCTGDKFPDYFGTQPLATHFQGYIYFPEGVRYKGIHTIAGTGLDISTTFLSESFLADFYLYQDAHLGTGKYSTDLRGMLNLNLFKLEAFMGITFPAGTFGLYRTGLMLFYKTGTGGEFFTQIGIPRWDPGTENFDIDLFYFLFEPRVVLNGFSIILTLFWHPKYYLQQLTGELGSVDININFLFGQLERTPLSGGVESSLAFSTVREEQFKAILSPYLGVITSGVFWNFKLNVKLFPFELAEILEAFIGVKAEF